MSEAVLSRARTRRRRPSGRRVLVACHVALLLGWLAFEIVRVAAGHYYALVFVVVFAGIFFLWHRVLRLHPGASETPVRRIEWAVVAVQFWTFAVVVVVTSSS